MKASTAATVRRIASATCLPLLLATLAHAQTLTASVSMDGAQETPPVVTGGTATATVTVNPVTKAVTVSGSYTGLSSSQTLAHIHSGAIGVAGGIAVTLTGTGGTSGTFSGSGILTTGQFNALLQCGLYLNIHTSSHSLGEIRGQIQNLSGSAQLGTDPTLADTGGNALIGPKINDPVETFNVSLDCSNAGAPGHYSILIHFGNLAPPATTPYGFQWFSGPKIIAASGNHTQNVVSFAPAPGITLPNDASLIGAVYNVQGFCFDPTNAPGRLSSSLIQVIR